MAENNFLELSNSPVRFEAVNSQNNVFFDATNQHIFCVRSGGCMGVVVKGPPPNDKVLYFFRLEDRGPLRSLKFNTNHSILALQRSLCTVEFLACDFACDNPTNVPEFSKLSKKSKHILGFVWIDVSDIAFITVNGVELYAVHPTKRNVKFSQSVSLHVEWFLWCGANKLVLLAYNHSSHLQPCFLKSGAITKLPKLDLEPGRMALEQDVTLASLYGVPTVLIYRHQADYQSDEIHLYSISNGNQSPTKSHILNIGIHGRSAVNVVDNLILVHHQLTKTTRIFDIGVKVDDTVGTNVYVHQPISSPTSFKRTTLSLPGLGQPEVKECTLYSPKWVVFQPNIVIDTELGCLWTIDVCQKKLITSIKDLVIATQVALAREKGKDILIELLANAIMAPTPDLEVLAESLNYVNQTYRLWLDKEWQPHTASPVTSAPIKRSHSISSSPPLMSHCSVIITESDVCHNIIQRLANCERSLQRIEWFLMAYITSLISNGIVPQANLNELLISTLANQKKFVSIQQLLENGVITDSKQVACLLLTLSVSYMPAMSLALDMLARLKAFAEIQEVLLSLGKIKEAITILPEETNPTECLTEAGKLDDPILFHSIMHYFQQNTKFTKMFQNDGELKNLLEHYNKMFSDKQQP